jgi:hypothetical protein
MQIGDSKKPFHERHTFWSIFWAVFTGLAFGALAVAIYAWRCWGSSSGECEAIRKSLPWTSLAALAAAPSALLTWYWRTDHKKRDLDLAKSQDRTSRFASAVELLQKGAPGALYALEDVAMDSDHHYWPVMETIAGYVRLIQHAGEYMERSEPIAAQAAMKILGRRDRRRDPPGRTLDLSSSDLRQVELSGLNFDGARFDSADLREANLRGASLVGASFANVNAKGAWIDDETKLDPLAKAELEQAGARFDTKERAALIQGIRAMAGRGLPGTGEAAVTPQEASAEPPTRETKNDE